MCVSVVVLICFISFKALIKTKSSLHNMDIVGQDVMSRAHGKGVMIVVPRLSRAVCKR